MFKIRILFVSSGFKGIYPYFEKAIEEAFLSLNHSICKIAPEYTKETADLIESFKADFVLAFVGYKINSNLLDYLKKKGLPLGLWLTEDPYYIDRSFILVKDYEYIFTIDLGAAEFYKQKFQNKKIFHLPLGTDPSLYYPDNPEQDKPYDLCLVGYPYPNRIALINLLLNQTNYSILLTGIYWSKYFKSKKTGQLEIVHRWVEPEKARQIYSQTKIILNPHRPYNYQMNQNSLDVKSKSINNRAFDVAACGGFQLITDMPDLNIHFDVGEDIVSYSNETECIRLIHKFINDDSARDLVSHCAKERVLNSHSFTHRIQFIIRQITGTSSGLKL